SVSLRKVAHQVLTSEECQTFKEALKVFRTTKTPAQLVDRLEPLLDSPKKFNLLREIVLLLPAEQRPEFAALCRDRFKGAELMLQENHIAAEFQQRFGQKMAALTISNDGVGTSIGGATRRPALLRRTSVSGAGGEFAAANSTGLTEATASAAAAARRLRAAAQLADKERITLSDSGHIRKLSDEKTASVIKLKSATFQVRYRSKLPLFASLPEEEPPISASAAATAAEAPSSLSSSAQDFDDNNSAISSNKEDCSDCERDSYDSDVRLTDAAAAAVASKSRMPLSDLRDKGFWALNSPRRLLEEKRKQQAEISASGGGDDGGEERRRRHNRQRHRHRHLAARPAAESGDAGAAAAAATAESSGSKTSSLADTPAQSGADSQSIYRLLYASSAAAVRPEDQASLTSSTLEDEFMKTRHLRVGAAAGAVPASLAEDFDAPPASLDSSVERQRLYGLPDKADREVQCDLTASCRQSLITKRTHSAKIATFRVLLCTNVDSLSWFLRASSLRSGRVSHVRNTWRRLFSLEPVLVPESASTTTAAAAAIELLSTRTSGKTAAGVAIIEQRRSDPSSDAAQGCFGEFVWIFCAPGHRAELRQPLQRSPFVVASVVTGSAASDEGIQPGDQLLELEGEPVANMTLHQLALAVKSRHRIRLSLLRLLLRSWHLMLSCARTRASEDITVVSDGY
uniref:PDZ domain-containing protein n=1 Tax=Macrostomum lignano TaxID=282301 RepID=A0A1I8IXG8_9PLAT